MDWNRVQKCSQFVFRLAILALVFKIHQLINGLMGTLSDWASENSGEHQIIKAIACSHICQRIGIGLQKLASKQKWKKWDKRLEVFDDLVGLTITILYAIILNRFYHVTNNGWHQTSFLVLITYAIFKIIKKVIKWRQLSKNIELLSLNFKQQTINQL